MLSHQSSVRRVHLQLSVKGQMNPDRLSTQMRRDTVTISPNVNEGIQGHPSDLMVGNGKPYRRQGGQIRPLPLETLENLFLDRAVNPKIRYFC